MYLTHHRGGSLSAVAFLILSVSLLLWLHSVILKWVLLNSQFYEGNRRDRVSGMCKVSQPGGLGLEPVTGSRWFPATRIELFPSVSQCVLLPLSTQCPGPWLWLCFSVEVTSPWEDMLGIVPQAQGLKSLVCPAPGDVSVCCVCPTHCWPLMH